MLTFAQFLTEKFLKGVKGRTEYTEVFVNPTRSEFESVGSHKGKAQIVQPLQQYGDQCFYLGGILDHTALYIWDRDIGIIHEEIATNLPQLSKDSLPLYLYYFPDSRTLVVELAGWSASRTIISRFHNQPDALAAFCREQSVFKMFDTIAGY